MMNLFYQRLKQRFKPLLLGLIMALPLLMQADDTGGEKYRALPEAELNEIWKDKMGEGNFQPIEMPKVIRPGGPEYGRRVFYFQELPVISFEGDADNGNLFIGGTSFEYSSAVHPFAKDSVIPYFRVVDADGFTAVVKANFPGLQAMSRMEDERWNLDLVRDEMRIPAAWNSVYQHWENLPNFNMLMSSILIRRASQQDDDHVLVLRDGDLISVPKNTILNGGDNRNAMLAGLYDPAGIDHLTAGKFGWEMMALAFGLGLILPLGLVLFRRRKPAAAAPAADERFLELHNGLENAADANGMLKILASHFSSSDDINALIAETKIGLDRAKKDKIKVSLTEPVEKKPVVEEEVAGEDEAVEDFEPVEEPLASELGESAEAAAEEGSEGEGEATTEEEIKEEEQAEEPKEVAEKTKITIRSESIKKAEEVVVEVPKEEEVEEAVAEKKETEEKPVEKEEAPAVSQEKESDPSPGIDREKLLHRLSNQESPEEKLAAAVDFWDAEYGMDGEIGTHMRKVLRSHSVFKKVRKGFEANDLRTSLNTLALSFGGGHTTKVKNLMDRAEVMERFAKEVETDRKAPKAKQTDERGKAANHFAEVIQALNAMEVVAKQLPGGPQADFSKAAEQMMLGFVLDGIALDAAAEKPFEELKARYEGRLELFKDDVRFSKTQLSADPLKRANKLLHAFAGKAGGNEFYKAYLARYGDFLDKLTNYDDPPTLDELRAWWTQAFEMSIHAFDYFRYTVEEQDNHRARLNVMMVVDSLRLHELPDGDVRPFSENVTNTPRAVRNAREMARSIGISRLDTVLVDGYYIHPKSLKPVD